MPGQVPSEPARLRFAAYRSPGADDSSRRRRYANGVPAVRRLIAQRHLAALLCAATLLLKLLMPAGYMIGSEHGRVTVMLCSGVASGPMAMPNMHGETSGHGKTDHGKAEMPCPFASLASATLGSADPIQLAELVAFVMAVGLLPAVLPAIARRIHLRPPLRGPPALV